MSKKESLDQAIAVEMEVAKNRAIGELTELMNEAAIAIDRLSAGKGIHHLFVANAGRADAAIGVWTGLKTANKLIEDAKE